MKKNIFTRDEMGELYNATVNLRQFVEGYVREQVNENFYPPQKIREGLDRIEKLQKLTEKIHSVLWPTIKSK